MEALRILKLSEIVALSERGTMTRYEEREAIYSLAVHLTDLKNKTFIKPTIRDMAAGADDGPEAQKGPDTLIGPKIKQCPTGFFNEYPYVGHLLRRYSREDRKLLDSSIQP